MPIPLDMKSRPIADRLARALTETDGSRIIMLMQQLGLLHQAPASISADAEPEAGKAIGPWRRTVEGDQVAWVRTSEQPPGVWADVQRIEQKRSRYRIVWHGESVARGYFYDPEFTPATCLSSALTYSGVDVDVIDLARVDQRYSALRDLAVASLDLDPDVMVVFAGNNWAAYDDLDPRERTRLAELVRCHGSPVPLARLLSRRAERRAESLVRQLASLCASHGCSLVIVIPEFNLRDWRDPLDPGPPAGTGDCAHWSHIAGDAERFLIAGRLDEAIRATERLIALDAGLSPLAWRIRAQSFCAMRDSVSERTALEALRDIAAWRPSGNTPRCTGATQRGLRRACEQLGVKCVDLPEVLQRTTGALPGRELFHDYCHLTVDGIHIAIAHIAEAILANVGAQAPTIRQLVAEPSRARDSTCAVAHALSACHNANWGQTVELVMYHLRASIALWPEIRAALPSVAELSASPIPARFTTEYERLRLLDAALASRVAAWQPELTQLTLIDAITSVLDDRALTARVEQALVRVRGVVMSRRDLLQAQFARHALQQLNWLRADSVVFSAIGRSTRFVFYCEECSPLRFEIVYRTPWVRAGDVLVVLNENQVAALPASPRWTAASLSAPAAASVNGRNELAVVWPEIDSTRDALALAVDEWEVGRPARWHASFGELHAVFCQSANAP